MPHYKGNRFQEDLQMYYTIWKLNSLFTPKTNDIMEFDSKFHVQ